MNTRKYIIMSLSLVMLTMLFACKKAFLDIIPDNLPVLDHAFTSRVEAEKVLFTCYSYLPKEGNQESNPGFNAGDEHWYYKTENFYDLFRKDPYMIARGAQNTSAPYMNYWGETNSEGKIASFDGRSLWQGIRVCNIMLENIDKVHDLGSLERDRWVAEVKFLKAYYHWYLFRMYGPIPIVDENLPVGADPQVVKIKRQPVDSVVNYIVNLIDEAAAGDEFVGLPSRILNQTDELGRITKVAALSIKARVLVTAASPLFNGNTDYRNLKNKDGEALFNQTYEAGKWKRAEEACKVALDAASAAGVKLYTFQGTVAGQTPEITTELSIRNAITERWNSELIWGSTVRDDGGQPGAYYLQRYAAPNLDPAFVRNEMMGQVAPTFKMAELFYTNNGVPIEEDEDWDYDNRFKLKATPGDSPYLIPNYQTAGLHFDREPRFYADMAFDGAKWYMKNNTSATAPFQIKAKALQNSGMRNTRWYSVTGYFTKKVVSWTMTASSSGVSTESYPWPVMRLADLMLLYAETLNETGKGSEALPLLNEIRERAGLESVEISWSNHAKPAFKAKYTTSEGLRDIIRQERGIEMAFEASRFWDLRRWKTAEEILNAPIFVWNVAAESFEDYNQRLVEFNQTFIAPRDYLWPISDRELQINSNLVQNTGW